MAADGRLVCGSGDHHDSLPKTESCSLNPEVCELESLLFLFLFYYFILLFYYFYYFIFIHFISTRLTPGGNTKYSKVQTVM